LGGRLSITSAQFPRCPTSMHFIRMIKSRKVIIDVACVSKLFVLLNLSILHVLIDI